MAVDERSRHQLFVKLEATLGSEEATTLMEHLPQVHHDEVVTKAYLDMRLEAMEARILAKISQETRVVVFALVAVVVSISSVALFR
jgi:hypothetical protein